MFFFTQRRWAEWPYREIGLMADERHLVGLWFLSPDEARRFPNMESVQSRFPESVARSTPQLEQAAEQLTGYFTRRDSVFHLPLAPAGTDFQRTVWNALRKIPYGETASYGKIAEQIGQPKSARAVGAACGANPIPIFIPCHRVIAASGGLGGFSGGLDVKRFLLAHEKTIR